MRPLLQEKTGSLGEEGFTFTELLVAITLLALISIPILGLLVNGYTYTAMAGRQTIAANLCRDKLEELKADGFNQYYPLVKASPGSFYQIDSVNDPLPAGYENYRRETLMWEVYSGADNTVSFLRVKVTVFWTERGGERYMEMETNLARG
jgi:prepilin-type N-terminal cleavage/methylation domain-containing protein